LKSIPIVSGRSGAMIPALECGRINDVLSWGNSRLLAIYDIWSQEIAVTCETKSGAERHWPGHQTWSQVRFRPAARAAPDGKNPPQSGCLALLWTGCEPHPPQPRR